MGTAERWGRELGEKTIRGAGGGELSEDGHRLQDSRSWGPRPQSSCQTLHRLLIADPSPPLPGAEPRAGPEG